jgi:hypothetical protein
LNSKDSHIENRALAAQIFNEQALAGRKKIWQAQVPNTNFCANGPQLSAIPYYWVLQITFLARRIGTSHINAKHFLKPKRMPSQFGFEHSIRMAEKAKKL